MMLILAGFTSWWEGEQSWGTSYSVLRTQSGLAFALAADSADCACWETALADRFQGAFCVVERRTSARQRWLGSSLRSVTWCRAGIVRISASEYSTPFPTDRKTDGKYSVRTRRRCAWIFDRLMAGCYLVDWLAIDLSFMSIHTVGTGAYALYAVLVHCSLWNLPVSIQAVTSMYHITGLRLDRLDLVVWSRSVTAKV